MEWIAAWLVLTVVFMWLTGGAHTRRLIAGVMPATPPRFSTGGREGVLQEFLAGADTESLEYPDVSNLLVDLRRADSRSDTSLLGARRLDELVSDLRTALTAHEREPIPPGAVWKEPCGWGLFGETKSFAGESPIDPEALTAVAGDYLKTPLVQSNLFEHYLLVGFLFDAIARGHHNMLRQQDGRLNVAYELANGNMTLMLVYRTGFLVAGFLARWVAVPGALGIVYWRMATLPSWALGLAGVWIAYLTMYAVRTPPRMMRTRRIRTEVDRKTNALKTATTIYRSVKSRVFNPSQVKDGLAALTPTDVEVPSVVFAILDRAIARDATAFAI